MTSAPVASGAVVNDLQVRAFRVSTDGPEADGTFAWDATVLVLCQVSAGGGTGLGFSYADAATARFIETHLRECVMGVDAFDIPRAWASMAHKVRNLGRPGIASMAISAVDTALWDLKAKLLGVPLARLFGSARDRVPAYGSGGFTSYSIGRLKEQLGGWAAQGLPMVKMKVGSHPEQDPARVRAARDAIGPDVALFVDANGAYSRKQALAMAEAFVTEGVTWFEEPVSSDDLEGLRLLRDRAPSGLEIAAGEYGYDLVYFRRMLEAGAVDVLQADVTRCGGFTAFLRVAALCEAFGVPLSAHTSPSLHTPVALACQNVRHVEYFYDHYRIEQILFEGARVPVHGMLQPDLSAEGLGLQFREKDGERYAIDDGR